MGLSRPWEQHDFLHAVGALGRSATLAEACEIIGKERGRQTSPRSLRDVFDVGTRRFPHLELKSPGHYLNQTGQVPVTHAQDVRPSRSAHPGLSASVACSAPERPYVAPRSMRRFPEPEDFTTRPMRVLIIPDVHVPNHHELAWSTCLAAIRQWQPDRVVILGDFADAASISSHTKSPEKSRLLSQEVGGCNAQLDRIDHEYVSFLEGNHCERLGRYIAERAPELFGLVSMSELLRINERGWQWHPYKTTMKIGKLSFSHDLGFAGKNAAWQNLAAAGKPIVTGHTHWATIVYQGHDDGTRHVSATMGWLGDPERAANYRPLDRARREWQHGFGTAEIDRDGVAWVNFRPIIDGRVIVDGQVICGEAVAA